MRQTWIEFVTRMQRMLARKNSASGVAVMVVDAGDRSVSVGGCGFQIEAIHMHGMIVYLVASLAKNHPEMKHAQELKAAVEGLLGNATSIITPNQVN